jgi:hypothetical protein
MLAFLSVLIISVGIISKTFNENLCVEDVGTIILGGQFMNKCSVAILPTHTGLIKYSLSVESGSIRINHLLFNPDGATWSLSIGGNKRKHYDIFENEHIIFELNIGKNFGKIDKIKVINPSFTKQAIFSYRLLNES